MRASNVKPKLELQCPKCKFRAPYSGYPSEPILSTILCLACGYAGPGATFKHFHPPGKWCGKAP